MPKPSTIVAYVCGCCGKEIIQAVAVASPRSWDNPDPVFRVQHTVLQDRCHPIQGLSCPDCIAEYQLQRAAKIRQTWGRQNATPIIG